MVNAAGDKGCKTAMIRAFFFDVDFSIFYELYSIDPLKALWAKTYNCTYLFHQFISLFFPLQLYEETEKYASSWYELCVGLPISYCCIPGI
jgi:hypothetical protein